MEFVGSVLAFVIALCIVESWKAYREHKRWAYRYVCTEKNCSFIARSTSANTIGFIAKTHHQSHKDVP